jgi:peptide/nickel transport system substrate-binding protein/oligopeptide transport system substrate-binding protein
VPGPPWEGGKRGGQATVVWPDPSVIYDPPLAYDLGGYYGLQNFYRGLGYYGLNAEPQLDQAESMDISDDGLEIQFKLKSGITFHNGREVTAEDYKWTFERAVSKDTGSWVQGFWRPSTGTRRSWAARRSRSPACRPSTRRRSS